MKCQILYYTNGIVYFAVIKNKKCIYLEEKYNSKCIEDIIHDIDCIKLNIDPIEDEWDKNIFMPNDCYQKIINNPYTEIIFDSKLNYEGDKEWIWKLKNLKY